MRVAFFFLFLLFLQTEGQSGERDASHRARSHRGSAHWSSKEEQYQMPAGIASQPSRLALEKHPSQRGGGSMAVAPLEQSWAAKDSCTVAPRSRAMMLMGAGASSSWGCGIRGSVLVICLAWHGISRSISIPVVPSMYYLGVPSNSMAASREHVHFHIGPSLFQLLGIGAGKDDGGSTSRCGIWVAPSG